MLSDLGLLSSLSALASELTDRTGIQVERGFAPGLPPLGPEAELVVYRVAQEALTNVARHSHARHVHLGLSRRGTTVCLRVADDGAGGGRVTPGAGVQGMQERAVMVGGALRIKPQQGGGTEVVLEVPVLS
jgi:two-component system sensor histidine kinase UhpB